MWTCASCGTPVPDGSEACPACGTPRQGGIVPRAYTAPQPDGNPVPEARRGEATSHDTALVLRPGWSRDLGVIRIDTPSCVLGREGDLRPELFSPSVSRQHVEIACADGTWTVTQLGTTNPSWVIGPTGSTQLAPGMTCPVHDGERLRLANQTFFVSVEARPASPATCDACVATSPAELDPPATAAPEPDDAPQDLVEGWFVTCPHCRTTFRLDGPEARMRSGCPVCTDAMDRRAVRRLAPQWTSVPEGSFEDVR